MSDTEIILQLLRRVEWRLRSARLLHDSMLAVSIVLALFIALKVWDLFSPLRSGTTLVFSAVCGGIMVGCLVWRFRQRIPVNHAAASVDLKAGLKDEIRT